MSRPGLWESGPDPDEDPAFDLDFERDSDEELPDPNQERAVRPKKSPSAFRTISEVADDLHIPQHVLRFWETRFPQVKPLKRGGGRRYYRPDDIALLRRISDLLYIQGYTIKGVQRLLREGDGTLSGDLPPPDVAERGDDADSPPDASPSRTSATTAAAPQDTTSIATPIPPEPSEPPPEPTPAPEIDALEREIAHLRATLADVLAGLVELRGRLPV